MSDQLCSDCPRIGYPTDETRCLPCPRRVPAELNAIARKVLGYHPKPKSEPAKKRQRARRKAEKARGRPNP